MLATEEDLIKCNLRIDNKLKMKLISLILLFGGFLCRYCHGQQADTLVYTIAEINPSFHYSTCTDFQCSIKTYFIDNYKMPNTIQDNGYTGSVYVEFIVEKDSTLSNIAIYRGIDNVLDKSIIESIKTMPKWIPGKNKGEIVRTKIILPILIRWLYGSDVD